MSRTLHDAIFKIPVPNPTLGVYQDRQFTQFMCTAAEMLSEAALLDLPVKTRADIEALWQRVRPKLPETSPEAADAVNDYVGLVRASPFGTDILGIYWGAFGLDGPRDEQGAGLEEGAAKRFVANIAPGFEDGFELAAGSFGRIALQVMRGIRTRPDLDLSRIALLLRGDTNAAAIAAIVSVLAACLTHQCVPGYLEFFTGEGTSVACIDRHAVV